MIVAVASALAIPSALPPAARAEDVSSPVILQWFESSYGTIESRMPDVLAAGYGGIYTPPPGRADSGDTSVGYDVYDRFDLGSAGHPTLYGTEAGLRAMIGAAHGAGMSSYLDLVWNHSGVSDNSTPGFYNSGGYPGFNLRLDPADPASQGYNDSNGDYHAAGDTGDWNTRLAGLVDIAQDKNYQMIRSPVDPNDSRNIRAGSIAYNGRIANVATLSNGRLYQDQSSFITVTDPRVGPKDGNGNPLPFKLYNFTNNSNGVPVMENDTGYLMRNARWLIQSVGADGFRLDATKNYPTWVLDYFDQAVFGANTRPLLDGSRRNVFSFGEYYDGNKSLLQSVVRKDIDASNPNKVGGNRDTLDFPLFFALRDNLTGNGLANNWNNIVNASFDNNDDGFNNGSQGVKFVSSHDNDGAYLNNVAYAYTLMMPGNAIVYFNPQQFGVARSGPPYYFPKAGRTDALGGLYGSDLTTLVDLRNRFGRGNYLPRLVEKENLAFEREKSAVVLLSNRVDSGYDDRTIQTSFAPGTYLIELTGNAASTTADPTGDIPQILQVQPNGTIQVRFLRNVAPGTGTVTVTVTGKGYLVYGVAAPQGSLTLSNVAQTLAGSVPTTAGKTADQIAYANSITRLADISVIKTNSFGVTLRTAKVNLLNNPAYRDHDADGDNAVLRIDEGLDLNGSGAVDYRAPGNVVYGFEEFTGVHVPGYASADNTGTYSQTVNAANLSEGYHSITARAFRHRADGGPAVFTDFRKTIYVDRLPPVSAFDSAKPWDPSQTQNVDFYARSVDGTGNNVHEFLNLPANLTDQQVIAMVGGNSQATQVDRDLWKRGYFGVPSGNNVLTTVTYEIDGNVSVQRFAGIALATSKGAGLGDLNWDGTYGVGDITGTSYGMEALVYPNPAGQTNTQFNPAADYNADGKIDSRDLYLMELRYKQVNAPQAVQDAARSAVLRRGSVNGLLGTNAADIDFEYTKFGQTMNNWLYDLNVDSAVSQGDVDTLVRTILHSQYGDANLDGRVDLSDFTYLAANFNAQSGAGWAIGDFSGDRKVDLTDFTLLAANFNWQYSGAPIGAIIPEPSTTSVLLLCLAAPLAGRSVFGARAARRLLDIV